MYRSHAILEEHLISRKILVAFFVNWAGVCIYASAQLAGYSSYATSPAGTDVACGGEYSSYATSLDGKKVCAGGWKSGH